MKTYGVTIKEAAKALRMAMELAPPIHPLMFAIRKELYPDENWEKEEIQAWKNWNEFLNKTKEKP